MEEMVKDMTQEHDLASDPPTSVVYVLKQTPKKIQLTTSIIIPAYNEEKGLPIVLEKILSAFTEGACEVIVVDDGSNDNTSKVACRFPCCVVRHKVNRGKAEAMRTGIRHARGENIIFIDGDGSYPAEAIPRICDGLDSYDAVYGSRAIGRDNIPHLNRLGNMIFHNMIKYVYGFKASDYSTGLYGLKKQHLEAMNLRACDFNIEVEIAIKASRMKLKVKDIPVEYHPRVGKSKLSPWTVGLGHLKTIAAYLTWRAPQNNDHQVTTPAGYLRE